MLILCSYRYAQDLLVWVFPVAVNKYCNVITLPLFIHRADCQCFVGCRQRRPRSDAVADASSVYLPWRPARLRVHLLLVRVSLFTYVPGGCLCSEHFVRLLARWDVLFS